MNSTYRSEIDGLRCLSVIAVIVYHANINISGYKIVSGGFLGVDIFFVISGFLITNIFLNEYQTNGSISILDFFIRRVRRILPILYLVLIFTIIGGWIILLPHSLVELSKSLLSTIFFSSNFYFYFYDQTYAAENSLLIPLLHTWSLSIEEQFYVIYPLFAYFFLRKRKFLTFLIFSFFLFFFTSLLIRSFSVDANFYFITSRGWELLAGAISAVYLFRKDSFIETINKIKFLNYLCLFVIIFCLFWFNDKMNLPGILTLFPVLSCCILLINYQNDHIYKILQIPIFVKVGLISYSLYLWHYPIFAFNRVALFSKDNFLIEVFLIIVLFVISFLSFKYVEKPFRDKNLISTKILSLTLLLVFFLLFLVSINIILNKGYLNRIPKILENHYKQNNYRNFSQDDENCHNRLGNKGFCKYRVKDPVGEIYLLGDSQTDAMLSSMIELSKINRYNLIHMSYSGNLFLYDFVIKKKNTNKILYDEKRHYYRYEEIKNSQSNNKIVIINGIYEKYFNDMDTYYKNEKKKLKERSDNLVHKNETNFEVKNRVIKLKKEFKKSIEMILNLPNTKVILVYPTPIPYRDLSQILLNKFNKKRLQSLSRLSNVNHFDDLGKFFNQDYSLSRKYYENINKEVFNFFDQLNYSNIIKIYPEKLLCFSKFKCKVVSNNNLIYFDKIHLSYEGSKLINKKIIEELN
jgi:peptidoglycan/LPS O-acetylase OafA/YrhL